MNLLSFNPSVEKCKSICLSSSSIKFDTSFELHVCSKGYYVSQTGSKKNTSVIGVVRYPHKFRKLRILVLSDCVLKYSNNMCIFRSLSVSKDRNYALNKKSLFTGYTPHWVVMSESIIDIIPNNIGKILGPRRLMPSKQLGSLVQPEQDIISTVNDIVETSATRVVLFGGHSVNVIFGKASMAYSNLYDNLNSVLNLLIDSGVAPSNGYIKISTTMGISTSVWYSK